MWTTETLILFCILSFVAGEVSLLAIIALLSANRSNNNGNK